MASIKELNYYGSNVELAPMTHASSESTYGLGSGSLYGHVKLSDSITDDTSDVDGAVAATPKAVNTVSGNLGNHASCEATNTISAHVKLSDSVSDSSNGVSEHIAATPKAVNTVNTSLETHVSTYANATTYGHVTVLDSPSSTAIAANHYALSPKGLYDHTTAYANASAYGHVMITDSYTSVQSTSNAANHWTVSPAALYGHCSQIGASGTIGHVKLSDSHNDSSNDTTKGIAATPKAVCCAWADAKSYGANLSNATGTLAIAHGGTGRSSVANGAVYATSSTDTSYSIGTLPVAQGGTGMTTASTNNAVVIGNSSNAANAMQTVATGNGAFYAEAANGKPKFGTLPVAQGGTGLTANPSMLTDLASGTAASVLTASPRPGVTGILGRANGGTGRSDADVFLSGYTLYIVL